MNASLEGPFDIKGKGPSFMETLKERGWEEEGAKLPLDPPINLETKKIVAF
jgi:hypothetical protein